MAHVIAFPIIGSVILIVLFYFASAVIILLLGTLVSGAVCGAFAISPLLPARISFGRRCSVSRMACAAAFGVLLDVCWLFFRSSWANNGAQQPGLRPPTDHTDMC